MELENPQQMLTLDKVFMRKGYLHSHKMSPLKSLTYHKGEKSESSVEKPGIHRLHQVIKGGVTRAKSQTRPSSLACSQAHILRQSNITCLLI